MVSLIRDMSYDPKTKQLVTYPVVEYTKLRNATFLKEKSVGVIAAGSSKPLSAIPSSAGGAVDLLVSFDLADTEGASTFGVSVRSGAVKIEIDAVSKTPSGFTVSVNFFAGPTVPRHHPKGQPTPPPTPPAPRKAMLQVLAGETLDIRMLVDRPAVEIFVNHGRAAFISADGSFDPTKTGVMIYNKGSKSVTASSVSAYGMSCGWTSTKPKPADVTTTSTAIRAGI